MQTSAKTAGPAKFSLLPISQSNQLFIVTHPTRPKISSKFVDNSYCLNDAAERQTHFAEVVVVVVVVVVAVIIIIIIIIIIAIIGLIIAMKVLRPIHNQGGTRVSQRR